MDEETLGPTSLARKCQHALAVMDEAELEIYVDYLVGSVGLSVRSRERLCMQGENIHQKGPRMEIDSRMLQGHTYMSMS